MGKKIDRAIVLAAEAHSGQTRDGGEDYIAHPIRVKYRLIEHGFTDENMLAAAVLHDTIEDTYLSYSDILSNFGDEIADIVREVSSDMRYTKAERREEELDHARNMSFDAAFIKIADSIDNLSDMHSWGEKQRKNYLSEKVDLLGCLLEGPLNNHQDHSLVVALKVLLEKLGECEYTETGCTKPECCTSGH